MLFGAEVLTWNINKLPAVFSSIHSHASAIFFYLTSQWISCKSLKSKGKFKILTWILNTTYLLTYFTYVRLCILCRLLAINNVGASLNYCYDKMHWCLAHLNINILKFKGWNCKHIAAKLSYTDNKSKHLIQVLLMLLQTLRHETFRLCKRCGLSVHFHPPEKTQ